MLNSTILHASTTYSCQSAVQKLTCHAKQRSLHACHQVNGTQVSVVDVFSNFPDESNSSIAPVAMSIPRRASNLRLPHIQKLTVHPVRRPYGAGRTTAGSTPVKIVGLEIQGVAGVPICEIFTNDAEREPGNTFLYEVAKIQGSINHVF